MSTKTSKRTPKLTERLIAATKILIPQTRRPRKKKPEKQPIKEVEKKEVEEPEKPVSPKQVKIETKSPKVPKISSSKRASKESLLKKELKETLQLVSQAEYYPEKLRRTGPAKKIVLKPQHNFTVLAVTNKRKRGIPHKDIKVPPPSKILKADIQSSFNSSLLRPARSSSPGLTVHDMILMMDDDNLNDEDFMEILTCPSPVWWEDPPDNTYIEEAIYTRSPRRDESPKSSTLGINNYNTRTEMNKTNNHIKVDTKSNSNDAKYVNKKLKLESILGNIKNKTGNTEQNKTKSRDNVISSPTSVSNSENSTQISVNNSENAELISINNSENSGPISVSNSENSGRISVSHSENSGRISVSEGEDYLDLSFNEDEILNNLENMDIPIEKSEPIVIVEDEPENGDDAIDIKPNILKVPDKMPPLTRRPDIKKEIPVFTDVDSISDTNIRFISEEDVLPDTSSDKEENSDEISSFSSCIDVKDDDPISIEDNYHEKCNELDKSVKSEVSSDEKREFIRIKKSLNDLSDYITVYKIIPETLNNNIQTNESDDIVDNANNFKIEPYSGKLNDFFKKRKNNKRPKKATPNSAFSVVHVNEIKKENEISDAKTGAEGKNRLNRCDYCVENIENGVTDFYCEKCDSGPTFTLDSCNVLSGSHEVRNKPLDRHFSKVPKLL